MAHSDASVDAAYTSTSGTHQRPGRVASLQRDIVGTVRLSRFTDTRTAARVANEWTRGAAIGPIARRSVASLRLETTTLNLTSRATVGTNACARSARNRTGGRPVILPLTRVVTNLRGFIATPERPGNATTGAISGHASVRAWRASWPLPSRTASLQRCIAAAPLGTGRADRVSNAGASSRVANVLTSRVAAPRTCVVAGLRNWAAS